MELEHESTTQKFANCRPAETAAWPKNSGHRIPYWHAWYETLVAG